MDGSNFYPRVGISYAWADETFDPLVRKLCKCLQEEDEINVFWDEDFVVGDRTDQFFDTLTRSVIVIFIISEEFFKSPYCMLNELLPVFRREDFKKDGLSKKTIFLVLESALPFLKDAERSDNGEHPLKPIRDYWEKAKEKEKSIGRNEGCFEKIRDINDLLDKDKGINAMVDIINNVKLPRGAEDVKDKNFAEMRRVLKKMINDIRSDFFPIGNFSCSNTEAVKASCAALRAKNPAGLPLPKTEDVSSRPQKEQLRQISLSLMLLLDETGEPNRFKLIPELHVISPRELRRDEWPKQLREAETYLQPTDKVMVSDEGNVEKDVGLLVKEWLRIVRLAAHALNQESKAIPPVVLELFVPKGLLHHDFGSSLHIPITDTPRQLGSHTCYMVRSIDRARDYAENIETLRAKWAGSAHKLLVVSRCKSGADEWHEEMYNHARPEDVGLCVVLPALSPSSQTHNKLLDALIDNFLPLVVFWPHATREHDGRKKRLAYVADLIDAAISDIPLFQDEPMPGQDDPRSDQNDSMPDVYLLEVQGESPRIDGVAKKRKTLREMAMAVKHELPGSNAIVLMDDPDRWPRLFQGLKLGSP